MTDDSTRHDGLADVINLLAAPIAGGIRTVEQFRKGVDELFRAVDNLNRTMENLNEAAERFNGMVAELEEPVRVMVPQITRTVRTADEITSRLEGPIKAAAPNIEKIAEVVSSPAFATLPNQLNEFMNVIGDVSKRLGPLTQFAETAGGLFGGLKLPGTGSSPPATRPAVRPSAAAGTSRPSREQPAKQASTAKKVTTTKPRIEESSPPARTERSSAKKKSSTKGSGTEKSSAERSSAEKSSAKKSSAKRKSEAKKSSVKQSGDGKKS